MNRLLTGFIFFLAAWIAAQPVHARFPAALHVDHRYPNDITKDNLGHWDFISGFPTGVDISNIPEYEKALGSGMHVDTAWRWFTSGDPRVIIAVYDSGIQWDNKDILNKHLLNKGELPLPKVDRTAMWPGMDDPMAVTDCTQAAGWQEGAGVYDVNHDGVFNIKDYRCDSRVHPQDGVDVADDLLDPSDLIHAQHTDFAALENIDGDNNGYVDDISGWDFMWNDNDPYDDTRYHHGTGEAGGSTGEVDNAEGKAGTCPDCTLLNVRVSDSYVADSNALAQGIIFGVDHGIRVIQSALGPLTGSIYAQAAIDYAVSQGVIPIMSAADETSMHHFPISSGEHTVMVHAIVPNVDPGDMRDTPPSTFMQFSNCTNYGAHLFISTPSTTCSSGAVKSTAGVAGLLYSYALQNGIENLSANEVQQLLRAGADDINDPSAKTNKKRFPSQEGWDQHFGYGRTNAENSLRLMSEGKIPPEADIDGPRWFTVIDPSRTPKVKVTGLANAPRSNGYDWELTYAYGIEPLPDAFTNVIANGSATKELTEFGEWDLSKVDFDAAADYGDVTSANSRDQVDQFTFTLRLQVKDKNGNVGEYRKVVYFRRDPTMLPGFPMDLRNSGESSPKLADIDGDNVYEIVLALADGSINVINGFGEQLPGWPVRTKILDSFGGTDKNKLVNGAAGFAGAKIGEMYAGNVATPAIGKLDGKNVAIVVATLEGDVIAFGADGKVLSGFPQRIDPVSGDDTNPVQHLDDGYFASPALADLDGDGTLEIIAAAMDGNLYVYDHQGKRVAPFPVEIRDPSVGEPADYLENTTSEDCVRVRGQLENNAFAGKGHRSRIISSPSIGDVDGDGKLEIVIGSGEIYKAFCSSEHTGIAEGTSRLYAFKPDGTQAAGFPMKIPDQTNILPFVGRGIPISIPLVDYDKNGTSDMTYHQIAQLAGLGIFDHTNKPLITFDQGSNGKDSNIGSGDVLRSKPYPVLINNGSYGDLDNDGVADFFLGGVSSDMLVSLSNDGQRRDADHMLMGFSGKTGEPLDGFPRVMEDIQFFMNPAIADLDGDGLAEVINGSGGFLLHAWNHKGERPKGWPKFTGQWLVASPAVGDINGDGYLDVVINSRDGFLFAWSTKGPAQRNGKNAVQWASMRHDNHNTGNADTELPMQSGPDNYQKGGCGCDSAGSAQRLVDLLAGVGLLVFLISLRKRTSI